MASTPDRQKVDEVLEIAHLICNEWEIRFLQDMTEWTGIFTEKQKAVIEKLYKRACESPY